jgi:hypothetical protein
MICPKCQAELPNDARVCGMCRHPLVALNPLAVAAAVVGPTPANKYSGEVTEDFSQEATRMADPAAMEAALALMRNQPRTDPEAPGPGKAAVEKKIARATREFEVSGTHDPVAAAGAAAAAEFEDDNQVTAVDAGLHARIKAHVNAEEPRLEPRKRPLTLMANPASVPITNPGAKSLTALKAAAPKEPVDAPTELMPDPSLPPEDPPAPPVAAAPVAAAPVAFSDTGPMEIPPPVVAASTVQDPSPDPSPAPVSNPVAQVAPVAEKVAVATDLDPPAAASPAEPPAPAATDENTADLVVKTGVPAKWVVLVLVVVAAAVAGLVALF